jgi:hypothetical protein
MKTPRKRSVGAVGAVLACLLVGLAVSAFLASRMVSVSQMHLDSKDWKTPTRQRAAGPLDFQSLEHALAKAAHPVQAGRERHGLLTSELRVVAIGSAYPIPYEAEVCPFSGVPQPSMNQLDRDGDGITDDWEQKYGLDKYNAADAAGDLDGDGFTNLEEFRSKTEPVDSASHPPYATKLRFVERKDVPFPYVFQGVTELPDGQLVFQINTPADGKTYFKGLGDVLEDIILERFIPEEEGRLPRVTVLRGDTEIELVRGKETVDPESQVELINVLDRSSIIGTMGALLSLRNDEYTVLGVYQDKVVLKHLGTGEVFDIVGLAEGE